MKLRLPVNPDDAVLEASHSRASISFQLKGHLAVLNLRHLVMAIDLMDRRVLWERSITPPTSAVDPQALGSVGQTGPVDSPYVCLQTRQGFQLVDALTGTLLWRRADFTFPVTMFGDDRHVYTVETNGRDSSARGRCLRLGDGAEITVPEFAQLFQSFQVTSYGRTVLVEGESDANGPIWRLYDVHAGKNVWSVPVPVNTVILNSTIDGLGGYVTPRGELTIMELKTKKTLLNTKLERAHMEKLNQASLFGDDTNYYLALSAPADNQHTNGEATANWQGTEENVPVNGYLYAFNRKTGKLAWFHALENQYLLMDQQEELPILLASSNVNRMVGSGQIRFTMTCAIDKRTGKQIYRQEFPNNGSDQPFCSIHFDRGTGAVELNSPTRKVRLMPETSTK
jgi:outer membrane protein assembly factor BamB